MKRHAPAWTHGSASCTMTLGRLSLQVVPLMQGACFLDRYRSSEPAEEPYSGSIREAYRGSLSSSEASL